MHICFLAKTIDPKTGGLGRHVLELTNSLVERGHDVTVITREGYSCEKAKAEVVEVSSPELQHPALNVYSAMPGVYKALKKRIDEFDVVHGHGWISVVYPLFRKFHSTDTPFVYTLHGVSSQHISRKWLKPLAELVSKPEDWNVDEADKLIAVSKDAKERAADYYDLKPEKVEVVYNGVDTENFTSKGSFKNQVLFVGHMNSRKGPHILLEAFENVAKDFNDTDLVFVGEGRDLEEIKNKVGKKGLEDRTRFLSDISEEKLIELYSTSVFVLPSSYEGLGMVYLEAMSCGSPVIGCRNSAVPEVIKDGETGYLVDRSTEAVEEALRKLLSSPEDIEEMGKAGREWVVEDFTWSEIARRTEQIYREL
ncbi:MAG: glycosyltransferase family 4 protein [Candidatus Nanohaloarchaeota archaeon QJJ-9]|nr:glycosyltransferase family 4 protein [Candidatus Nanohaloarchaeota archaeon QJJ-9]